MCQVIVEYTEEAVGRQAFDYAQALIAAALAGAPFDSDAVVAELRDLDESERMGPSTGAIVEAAAARGIPWRRLTQGSLVQFGWGPKQRRIQAAEIDATSAGLLYTSDAADVMRSEKLHGLELINLQSITTRY